MNEVLSAVAAYKRKESDLTLVLASMGKNPELYPDTQRRANELTDEIINDARQIGLMMVRMKVGVIGGEL